MVPKLRYFPPIAYCMLGMNHQSPTLKLPVKVPRVTLAILTVVSFYCFNHFDIFLFMICVTMISVEVVIVFRQFL